MKLLIEWWAARKHTIAVVIIGAVCYRYALGQHLLWPLLVVPVGVSMWWVRESAAIKSPIFFRMWFLWTANIGASLYWIEYVVRVYGQLWFPASTVPLLLLAMYCGLYGASAGWAATILHRAIPKIGAQWWFALIFTGLEVGRERWLTGFGWSSPGYGFGGDLLLSQAADVFGVSWLMLLGFSVLAASFDGRRGRIAAIGLLAVWYSYGAARVWQYSELLSEKSGKVDVLDVALVQGNIDQLVKWDRAFSKSSIDTYLRLSQEATTREKTELVIWPETAIPRYMQQKNQTRSTIEQAMRSSGTALLAGAPAYSFRDGQRKSHNRAYLWNSDGQQLGHVDKRHLVPFGEYVPLDPWLSFIDKMVVGVGNFKPGEGDGTLILDVTGDKEPWRIGMSICYEIIFSQETRETLGDADLGVVISNDAWFGPTDSPYQQWGIARLRAIENRVPIVRAGNTGISGVIDILGRATKETDIYVETSENGHVPRVVAQTLFQRVGNIWEYFIMFVGLVGLGAAAVLSRKNKRENEIS